MNFLTILSSSAVVCVSSLDPELLFTVLFSNTISDTGYVNHLDKIKVLVEMSIIVKQDATIYSFYYISADKSTCFE